MQNYNNELYHWGIDGMKWGFRRYQNEDGTYTELGKERRRKGFKAKIRKEKINKAFEEIKNGKDKPLTSRAQEIARNSENIINKTSNIVKRYSTNNKDLSALTDDDLRKAINRFNLEKQYREIEDSYTTSGKAVVSNYLDTIGDVLAIGASAAVIYSKFKSING